MWFNIVSGIISLVSLGILLLYRRQIKAFCRQLQFIQKHETNKMISQDIYAAEITELVEHINKILKIHHQLELDYKKREDEIKNTIVSLSHDIRTPITSLKGYFELLLETEDEKEYERYSKIISLRIMNLGEILEQLFTYTKIHNNSFQLLYQNCDINRILNEVILSFYNDFKNKGIEPTVAVPEDSCIIRANEAAVKRILQNIIKNALDHGKEQIDIEMKNNENKVEIIIKNKYNCDDIIHMDKIFDSFYKADTSRNQQSTGLGLYIANELVRCMNGTISADIENDFFVLRVEFSCREV